MQVHEVIWAEQICLAKICALREERVERSKRLVGKVTIPARNIRFQSKSRLQMDRVDAKSRIRCGGPRSNTAATEAAPLEYGFVVVVPQLGLSPDS